MGLSGGSNLPLSSPQSTTNGMAAQADNSTTPIADELTGKTAVVTGSSTGMGRAIAIELAKAGADVLIHAHGNREAAEQTADKVRTLGRTATVVLCDLAETANQSALVDQAWQWSGGIDIWMNNAGVDVLTGAAADRSFEDKLDLLWKVDVVATMRISRLVGERMTQGGAIVNMGWDQAERGMAGDSGQMFGAIKGAVMAFTKSLAQTLAPRVRVNCVAPGWIKTSWGEQASQSWQDRAKREALLERWGTPEDVAKVVRFLASDAATFVTGQTIQVNGGFRYGAEDR